jgi:hypothetical protein
LLGIQTAFVVSLAGSAAEGIDVYRCDLSDAIRVAAAEDFGWPTL